MPQEAYTRLSRQAFAASEYLQGDRIILQLDDLSHDAGPVTFGVLSLTRDSATPPLPKGTYFVSYLAKANPNDKPVEDYAKK